jgi:hypothetical protein
MYTSLHPVNTDKITAEDLKARTHDSNPGFPLQARPTAAI